MNQVLLHPPHLSMPHGISHIRMPVQGAGAAAAVGAAGAASMAYQATHQHDPHAGHTIERGILGALGVASMATMAMFLDFVTMIITPIFSKPLEWMGFNRAAGWVRAPRAFADALKRTEIGNLGEFGLQVRRSFAVQQAVVGATGVSIADIDAKIDVRRASKLGAKTLMGKADDLVPAIGQTLNKGLSTMDESRVGAWMKKSPLQWLFNWRAHAKEGVIHQELSQAFPWAGTEKLSVAQTNAKDLLAKVETAAREAISKGDAEGLLQAQREAARIAQEQAKLGNKWSKAAAVSATQTVHSLQDASVALHKRSFWQKMQFGEEGMGGFLKAIPAALKKTTLMKGLFTLGVTAAAAATWIGLRGAGREDTHALKHFAADIYGVAPAQVTKDMLRGDNAHPAVKYAAAINSDRGIKRIGAAGLETAAHVVSVGTLDAAFSMKSMAIEGGLPMVAGALVPNNPVLSAHAALKQVQAGALKLDKPDMARLYGTLLSAVPSVAANGGEKNRVVAHVAHEMVARDMSPQQAMQVVAKPEVFSALTRDVMQKLEASKAASAATPAAKIAVQPEAKIEAGVSHVGRVQNARNEVKAPTGTSFAEKAQASKTGTAVQLA